MTDHQAAKLVALLQEAVAHHANDFDRDHCVSGADLVEWFADWRIRARGVLNQATTPPRKEEQRALDL